MRVNGLFELDPAVIRAEGDAEGMDGGGRGLRGGGGRGLG